MKVFSYVLVLAGFFLLATSCQSAEGNKTGDDSTLVQLNIPVSSATAVQVDSFLQAYYQLKDALVDDDSVTALEQTEDLVAQLDGISLDDINDDNQRKVVGEELSRLRSNINRMRTDSSIDRIRSYFEEISKNTYHLIKGAGLKKMKVYRTFCPMAFHGKGAYWLSNSSDIQNPYLGHKMMYCGEVRETLQF